MNLLLGLILSTIFCHIAVAVRFFSWFDSRSPPELVEEVVSMDSAINWAERKGRNEAKLEDVRNFIKMGIPIDQIAKGTALDLDTIKELQVER